MKYKIEKCEKCSKMHLCESIDVGGPYLYLCELCKSNYYNDLDDETRAKIAAQFLFCEDRGVPFVAPPNGRCFCDKQIFRLFTLEECKTRYINTCPNCKQVYAK